MYISSFVSNDTRADLGLSQGISGNKRERREAMAHLATEAAMSTSLVGLALPVALALNYCVVCG